MNEQDFYQSFYSCELCHQAPVDTTENPNSRLCKRCRENAIHYPIPKIFIPIAAVLLVLTAVAFFQMPEDLSDYRLYATAEAQIQQGMLYDTLSGLEEMISRHPDSTDAAIRLVTLSMDYGCYDYAAYCMDTYLVGKSLSDTDYGEMIHYQNILTSYYDTYNTIDEFWSELDQDMDQGLIYTSVQEKLKEMREDSQMYQPLVCYYTAYFSDSQEERKENLMQCLDGNPMDFYARTELGTLLRREGDYSGARSCYEQVLRYEKKEALANRGMAVLEMLDGNMEQGLEYAQIAYENGPDETYVRDTYLVALFMNGKNTEAKQIKQEMEEAGDPIEEDTQALLSGQITLKEYYVEEDVL